MVAGRRGDICSRRSGAYYLNAWALTKVSPSTVAIYIYLQPLIAFGFAPLLLGERWNSRTHRRNLLIFAGVALVTNAGRSRAVREISEHPDALAQKGFASHFGECTRIKVKPSV